MTGNAAAAATLEAILREQSVKALDAYAAKLDSGPKALEGAWTKMGGHLTTLDDEKADQFRAKMVEVVEEIVAQDPQMQADYDVLKSAADANR